MQTLRIFISSPGDVAEERERARQVVQSLRRRYARHFDLVPVFWEDMPLGLETGFQEGIDLLLSRDRGVDIAVFVLWSRLGSALGANFQRPDGRPYRSGTERELDLMLQARAAQNGKRPHIIAYARQDEATFEEALRGTSTTEKEERLRQKKLVESFIKEEFHDSQTGTNLRAYHTYHRPQSFSERLRVHLQEVLDGLTGADIGRPAWEIDERGPPFLGLESFKFEHAEVFFGREDEVSEARLRLAAAAKRGTAFLLVGGGSGTGKSSLAAAGILPDVVAHEIDEAVSKWLHASFTPAALGGDPALGMGRILWSAVPKLAERGELADFVDGLRRDPAVAVKLALLPALKSEATKSGAVRLILLVDQLEEVFTDARLSDEARNQFAAILEALASSGAVWIVATLRGDFYPKFLGCRALVHLATEGAQLPLVPPGADALRRMIESPALLSGLAYEKTGETTLADRILRDVSGQAELLPLLEDLLRELFEKRSAEGVLTVAAYESLGGIEGSLAKRAEASLAGLPADVRGAFPDVLRRLVAAADGPEGTAVRRRVALDSFPPGKAPRVLVDRLIADRLATAAAGEDGTPEVSIAHEAILRVWPTAVNWIRENSEFLKLRDRLTARMREGAILSAGDPLVAPARRVIESGADTLEPELASFVVQQLAAIDADRRRQVRSRRIAIGTAAAMLVSAAIGGLVLQARGERRQREARAEGAVEALLQAGSGQIDAAAGAVADPKLMGLVAPRLRAALAAGETPARKLRAAIGLARLPDAPEGVWESLFQSLLVAEPAEVASIRSALSPRGAGSIERLWSVASDSVAGPGRLRAAAALAAFDPQGDRWQGIAPAIALDLVNVPAVHLATWLEALRDVRGKLVPELLPIFADAKRRENQRQLAGDILSVYAADDPATLAEGAMVAEPDFFTSLAGRIEAAGDAVAPLFEAELGKTLPNEMPLVAPEREALAIRQAKAAAVLMRLARPERVWPLFIHSPDPRTRSSLIHFLKPFAGDKLSGVAGLLAARLGEEADVSAKRGLVLAIGEVAGTETPGEETLTALREGVVLKLREIYEHDPDPGLHAAAEWTLRQFGEGEWIAGRVAAWREEAAAAIPQSVTADDPSADKSPVGPIVDPPQLAAIREELSGEAALSPRWFVNGQGQTFVVIPGPVEFFMGSTPETDADHNYNETRHRRRIGRSFAIGVQHVTLGEYEKIVADRLRDGLTGGVGLAWTRSDDLPVTGMRWFDAAAYCNRLSRAEGIPRREWVYKEDTEGNVTGLAPGWLALGGYRLPTEAEWEYVSRAGAATSRFFGQSAALLGEYAWYQANSEIDGTSVPWSVGGKKPNDAGVFDGLGNVWNWCQEAYGSYPEGTANDDQEGDLSAARDKSRLLRGGSFDARPSNVRSAYRNRDQPTNRNVYSGLRVARTLRPGPLTPLPEQGGSGEGLNQRAVAKRAGEEVRREKIASLNKRFLPKIDAWFADLNALTPDFDALIPHLNAIRSELSDEEFSFLVVMCQARAAQVIAAARVPVSPEDLTFAVTAAKRGVALQPDDFNMLDTLAHLLARQGNLDEAIATQRKGIEVASDERRPALVAYLTELEARAEEAKTALDADAADSGEPATDADTLSPEPAHPPVPTAP